VHPCIVHGVEMRTGRKVASLIQAAKARRLRHLAVEKGLLREVKGVQRILDALVQCRVSSAT
jgi:hypothetical protein